MFLQKWDAPSKQGSVLLTFQDQGVLGTKIVASNLNSQQRKDIRQLGQFRKDPLFLQKNSQFFSNPSPPVSDFSQKPPQNTPEQQLTKDFENIFQGLKYISQKLGKDINETNRNGFNIKTSDGGKGILLTRHGGGLVAVKNKTGEIEIPKYSTFDDANNLKQLVNKAVLKVNQSSQNKLNDVKFSKGR